MAKALCLSLYLKGAKVHYLTSMGSEGLPLDISTEAFEDAKTLLRLTQKALDDAIAEKKEPFLFMVAAVADFRPKVTQKGKVKKSSLGETWNISHKTQTYFLLLKEIK